MSAKAQSRWANTAEDEAVKARVNREREERKKKKADKLRQVEHEARVTTSQKQPARDVADDLAQERPAKRRRITHETELAPSADRQGSAKLLRLQGGNWERSRSVEAYEKLNDIEEGTYGLVSRAIHRKSGRVVALKRLKADPNDRAEVPVTGLREMQVLRGCRHRNIVGLEDVIINRDTQYGQIQNSIFLVLEFVEHDLKTILEDMPEPFLSSEVKRLLLQLTSGIAYLHDNWILHRDLKTSNILLNNRGQLKIADFGMARYVGDPPPHLTQVVVTLWYRAPELLLGTNMYDSAVDMWSVGCIFGELLTCKALLQGHNEVDQVSKIFGLCGVPNEESWPGFRRLPNSRSLKLPKANPLPMASADSRIRAKFPNTTAAGAALLSDLLCLDPARRLSANEALQHEYFQQDPKPKPESLFPTFPSKANQERRKRHEEPHAPVRGMAAELGDVDLTHIFQGRDKEERGAGFSLRMV